MKTRPQYSPYLAPALSLVSGAALAFALPPRNVWMLGWVAFLPLLAAARMTREVAQWDRQVAR